MQAYKVTRISELDGSHVSSSPFNGSAEVIYREGEPTVPKDGCGPLTLFRNLRDALDYAAPMGDSDRVRVVWEAEYEPSSQSSVWRKHGRAQCTDDLLYSLAWCNCHPMPIDIIFASSVTLIRKVG